MSAWCFRIFCRKSIDGSEAESLAQQLREKLGRAGVLSLEDLKGRLDAAGVEKATREELAITFGGGAVTRDGKIRALRLLDWDVANFLADLGLKDEATAMLGVDEALALVGAAATKEKAEGHSFQELFSEEECQSESTCPEAAQPKCTRISQKSPQSAGGSSSRGREKPISAATEEGSPREASAAESAPGASSAIADLEDASVVSQGTRGERRRWARLLLRALQVLYDAEDLLEITKSLVTETEDERLMRELQRMSEEYLPALDAIRRCASDRKTLGHLDEQQVVEDDDCLSEVELDVLEDALMQPQYRPDPERVIRESRTSAFEVSVRHRKRLPRLRLPSGQTPKGQTSQEELSDTAAERDTGMLNVEQEVERAPAGLFAEGSTETPSGKRGGAAAPPAFEFIEARGTVTVSSSASDSGSGVQSDKNYGGRDTANEEPRAGREAPRSPTRIEDPLAKESQGSYESSTSFAERAKATEQESRPKQQKRTRISQKRPHEARSEGCEEQEQSQQGAKNTRISSAIAEGGGQSISDAQKGKEGTGLDPKQEEAVRNLSKNAARAKLQKEYEELQQKLAEVAARKAASKAAVKQAEEAASRAADEAEAAALQEEAAKPKSPDIEPQERQVLKAARKKEKSVPVASPARKRIKTTSAVSALRG